MAANQERRLAKLAFRPLVVVVIAALAVLGTAAGITLTAIGPGSTATRCQNVFVPAFFYPESIWKQTVDSSPAPSVMILDISGLGAGSQPEAHFRSVVHLAQAAGVTVLGYSSTALGQRPIAQVEADVQNYKAWYGVTGMFLDEVQGVVSQLPYYQELASYIHHANPGSPIWINPGLYPDRAYMSVANVVMAFEGPYSAYRTDQVPGWVRQYPRWRFAHTVHTTSQEQLGSTVSLARSRNAGYLYVTDRAGSNPYDGLPSYWSALDSAVTKSCGHDG